MGIPIAKIVGRTSPDEPLSLFETDSELMISPHTLRRRSGSASAIPGEISSIHLVGICGSGMKALAELAVGLGWNVSGSDTLPSSQTLKAMTERGLRIHQGHRDEFLPVDTDVLVHSPAVSPANPERQMAKRLGIPQMSYTEMLGHLMKQKTGVCIAGTHGKSTTTAMTATVLQQAGLEPSAIIGAELCESAETPTTSGWAGKGNLFVVESCEYQRNFLEFHPRFAAVTNIEPDHFDYYKNFADTQAAFADFVKQIEPSGVLVLNGNCESAKEVASACPSDVATFSRQPGADWWAADIKATDKGCRFRVFYHGWFFSEICLQVPGLHNVDNALVATALSHYAGVDARDIRESLAQFRGIRRRFESQGSWRGIALIDDYAHHPTAVQATLRTAREQFGNRKIWGIFQPHQLSRLQALLPEFGDAFGDADQVVIAPVFSARESSETEAQTTSRELADRIEEAGVSATLAGSLDQILVTIDDNAEPGDVIITMGAGDINRIHHEFHRRLQRRSAA